MLKLLLIGGILFTAHEIEGRHVCVNGGVS